MDPVTHMSIAKSTYENNESLRELVEDYFSFLYSNYTADYDIYQYPFTLGRKRTLHRTDFKHLNDTTLGYLLHGEYNSINGVQVKGVDYYTHIHGYIEKNQDKVKEILKKKKLDHVPWLYHTMLEYLVGHDLAQNEKNWNDVMKVYRDFDRVFRINYENLKKEKPYFASLVKYNKHLAHYFFKRYLSIKRHPEHVLYSITKFVTAYILNPITSRDLENRVSDAFHEVKEKVDYKAFEDMLYDHFNNYDFGVLKKAEEKEALPVTSGDAVRVYRR